MEYLLSAAQMQRFDKAAIEEFGVPSCVLMERAAISVATAIKRDFGRDKKILVAAGSGNNGGDGIAIARLLMLDGYAVDLLMAAGSSGRFSKENVRQQEIYLKYGGRMQADPDFSEYDIIVDALFGVGLNRAPAGRYKQIIDALNQADAYVYAVDIPSGISADTGEVLGCAVKADCTVTFNYRKKGHVLFPGSTYCGAVEAADVGIYGTLQDEPYMYTQDFAGTKFLPERVPYGNKGTFGKLLVIAGSKETAGAAVMAAEAAFRMGCGMVKLITHQINREAVLARLPECMLSVYADETDEESLKAMVQEGCKWADAVLAGPGIGTGRTAQVLVEECLCRSCLPAVADADALNIMSREMDLYKQAGKARSGNWILTPHMGEFARLRGCTVAEAAGHKEEDVRQMAEELQCVMVCKDARTFVSDRGGNGMYCNLTGNHGMASAGSGDILAGMTAVLLMQEESPAEAALKAVWLHGFCGDRASLQYGKRSLKAADLLECLWKLIKESDEGHSEDR